MIEETILKHLLSSLDVNVYMQRPEKAPKRYVIIEKTGSSRANRIEDSTFAVQSCAESLYEAAKLNQAAKEAMDSLIELDEIGGIELNSDYNFTDPDAKLYRYQALYVITHY